MLSVLFQPYGAKAFFQIPMSGFCNETVGIEDAWGQKACELEEKMNEAVGLLQRISILETFLKGRLATSKDYDWRRIVHSVETINQAKSAVSVKRLADGACLSRKQYERVFDTFIGLSPGQFLKTVRFQNALFIQQTTPFENLTELAYACGYYDQSHMINDFKNVFRHHPQTIFYGM